MNEKVTTIPDAVSRYLIDRSVTMNLLLIVTGSFLLAASAQAAVTLSAGFVRVPMTLQPLALVLIGAALGSVRGAAAAALYLAEGLAGLPVFSNGGSTMHFMGPTAGFLLAFPLGAFVAGYFSERGWTRTFIGTFAAMSAALLVVHLGGWSWLATAAQLGPLKAFQVGNLPFLLSDLIKVTIAAALLPKVQSTLQRLHQPRS